MLFTRSQRKIHPGIIILLFIVTMLGLTLARPSTANAACASTPDASQGTDTETITVPSTGTYYLWSRILAPDTTNNSFYFQVDGGCAFDIGDSASIPANTWTWVNYQNGTSSSTVSMSLTAGTHTILMTGREPGVGVDRLLLLPDTSCTPTGTGSNCAPASPTISLSSPASGATVGGTAVNLAANATADTANGATISKVVFAIDGTTVSTDTSSPYSFAWNSTSVADGSHTLVATVTDSAGQTVTTQETFTVANRTCASGPSVPSGVAGTSSTPTTATITWGASTPASGCTISSYTIYRGGAQIGTSSTTTFNDSGLTPNTIYGYTISATDNGGHTSAQSATKSVTTAADTTKPSAPTAVTATAVNSASVKLTWGASTDNIAVAGYRVYKNSVLLTTVNGASTLTYTDNADTAATSYVYQVSAIDTSNNESALTDATPDPIKTPAAVDTTPPSAPSSLTAALITANTVSLSWKASTDNVGVAGYHVYRGSSLLTSVTGLTYTDQGLSASTAYQYHVIAYDASANDSASSNVLSVTTDAATAPTLVGDLNNDGVVNIFDLSILLGNYGHTPVTAAQGDLNADGSINIFDLSILLGHWGNT